MNPSSIAMAASTLLHCRQQQVRVASLASKCTPATLAEGYEIQQAVAQLRPKPLIGYKVGLTNERAQREAGTHEPIVGQLFAPDIVHSGATLLPAHSQMRAVEAEVTFQLGATLDPAAAPFKRSQVHSSIRDAFASIEVCDSRFVNCDDLTLPCIVADNSNAGALVLGESIAWRHESDFDSLGVALSRGHTVVAEGSTNNVLGNPLESLCWLANWLAARDIPLEAGQLVATGTCTPIITGMPGDHFVALFGTGAQVELTFAGKQFP